MKTTLARINGVSTSSYLTLCIAIFATACVIDALGGYLWVSHGVHTPRMEEISTAFQWIGLAGLILLLPVSAFRPFNKYSLHGHCGQRAKLFGITSATIIMIFAWVVWSIGKAV